MSARRKPVDLHASLAASVERDRYERLVIAQDRASGLRAIIAVHSTRRGPAVGGVRMWPYATLDEALRDALRLARAMTYKAAAARLPLGGGKAVIIGDPRKPKRQAWIEAFARLVHEMGGLYLTAEDVGMTMEDMAAIRRVTPFVTGTSTAMGGSGDPSEMTAHGVLHGIRAVAEELGAAAPGGVGGLTVAVQGVGKVGARLAALLRRRGARVIVADLDARRAARVAAEVGADVVPQERIHRAACDVFAPCALGGVLNRRTIGQLRCRAVAGSANNQLLEAEDGERLHRRGLLYAPDFVINAGGLINISVGLEPAGYDRDRAERRTGSIYHNLKAVFRLARERSWTPARAADQLAERRWREGRAWPGPVPLGAGKRRAIG